MITRFALAVISLDFSRRLKPTFGQVFRLPVCALLIVAANLRAEPIARELGENLRYFRAHVLPNDLPAANVTPSPVILDLRYTKAESEAATALDAWLKFRATPQTPVVVLLNPDTDPALLEVVIPSSKRADLVTVGRKLDDTAPDILIDYSAEAERQAYDALEHSTSVESLITENADKPRVDEASIMRDRAEGIDHATAPDNRNGSDKKIESPAPTVIDRSLQRAIHLHRALLALRRLQD